MFVVVKVSWILGCASFHSRGLLLKYIKKYVFQNNTTLEFIVKWYEYKICLDRFTSISRRISERLWHFCKHPGLYKSDWKIILHYKHCPYFSMIKSTHICTTIGRQTRIHNRGFYPWSAMCTAELIVFLFLQMIVFLVIFGLLSFPKSWYNYST